MISALALLVGLLLAQPAPTPRPFVFGINLNAGNDWECRLAAAAGCTNTRIGAGWDLVERTPGVYDWRSPDRAVDNCRRYGLEPFFLIVATPLWALRPEQRDKPWGHAPDPAFYPQAEQFYRMLAARYRGRVRYYEFWNEQNGYGWHATNRPEEYAPLLRLAYRALKQGDPGCVVAVGGLDGAGWKGYPSYLERLYALGCGESFDAVAVHPYRWDGPIDIFGLRNIRRILEQHGHGDRLLWITEYGWDKEYGHANRAKWLTESLDLLTSPELDFVFQASIHTLTDFDDAEFGLVGPDRIPRPAFFAFADYPKDWQQIAARQQTPTPAGTLQVEDVDLRDWTPYGDGLALWDPATLGVVPEQGASRVLAARATERPIQGGAWKRFTVPTGMPVRLSARVYTNQTGERADNIRCTVGLDPAGGDEPNAERVVWGRRRDTSGAWDTVEIGQFLDQPVVSATGTVTAFLAYQCRDVLAGQVAVFDRVQLVARPETFVLPQPRPIALTPPAAGAEQDKSPQSFTSISGRVFTPDHIVYDWRGCSDGEQTDFASTAGRWTCAGDAWLAAEPDNMHRTFLYCTANTPLPEGNWRIEAEVFAAGDLDIGLWAGEHADRCVMGILSTTSQPFNAWCLERNGPGTGGFGPRTNETSVDALPGSIHTVQLDRHDAGVQFLVDGHPAGACAEYAGPFRQFGLYVLAPERGRFNRMRVVRLP